MSDALRQVFAEFGVTVDDAKLDAMAKKVEVSAKAVRSFPTLNGSVDLDAVDKGTKNLQDRLSAVKVGFEQSFGQKTQAHLTRLVPGFERVADALGLDASKAAEFGRVFMRVSGAVVAGLAAMAVGAFAFANAFEADAAALRQTARDANTTTTQLQQLTFAGEQAGVSADTMRGAVAGLSQGLFQAARGIGGPISAFHRLGIRVRDARGQVRDTSAVMDDLARVLPRVQNPMRRLQIAQELFGSSARDMLAVLHTGEGGLAAYRAELEALGGGVTQEAIEASRRFGQAQVRLRYAFDGVRSNIMAAVAPAVTWLTNKIATVEGFIARTTRNSNLFRVALGTLGTVGAAAGAALLVAWAPVLLPLAKAGLVVAGLALALDDLSVFVQGGDSVLGTFLDRMGGVGTAASTARGLRDAWAGVGEAIRDSGTALGEARSVYTEAEAFIRPLLERIGALHVQVFRAAFGGVEESFGEVWNRVRTKALEMFDAVTRRAAALARAMGLEDLAGRLSGTVESARAMGLEDLAGRLSGTVESANDPRRETATGRLGQLAADLSPAALPALLGEWRNLLTSRPAATVPVPASGTRGAGRERPNRTTSNTWNISGADPRVIAAEVLRRQREEERRQRDEDHPVTAEDS